MQVIDSAEAFAETLRNERSLGRTIGLVPTMGALHEGHRSLIDRAAAECDVVAVTVFVNPLQFNDPSDLANYPRDFEGDALIASTSGAAVLFAPNVKEMYPTHPQPLSTIVEVGWIGTILEGASRHGHFAGVATVVTKLFSLAGKCTAYFGEKDFQQLAVIRQITRDLSLPVGIVGCPTVREPDGLAMSSRNVRLSPDQRAAATVLKKSLDAAIGAIEGGDVSSSSVKSLMSACFGAEPLAELDYAEIVDASSLMAPERLSGELRLLVAARFGEVRLIDNAGIFVDASRGAGAAGNSRVAGGPPVATSYPAVRNAMARSGRREN